MYLKNLKKAEREWQGGIFFESGSFHVYFLRQLSIFTLYSGQVYPGLVPVLENIKDMGFLTRLFGSHHGSVTYYWKTMHKFKSL